MVKCSTLPELFAAIWHSTKLWSVEEHAAFDCKNRWTIDGLKTFPSEEGHISELLLTSCPIKIQHLCHELYDHSEIEDSNTATLYSPACSGVWCYTFKSSHLRPPKTRKDAIFQQSCVSSSKYTLREQLFKMQLVPIIQTTWARLSYRLVWSQYCIMRSI